MSDDELLGRHGEVVDLLADTLNSKNNLAYAYQSAGRLGDAIPLYEETLADRLRVLGPNHPATFGSKNNLAVAYWEAGRPQDAISLLEATYADRLRILGPDHPDTLVSEEILAAAREVVGE